MSQRLRIGLIEPVGGHGGMHHYDIGLAGGLAAAGAEVTLHTSSTGGLEAPGGVEVRTTFRGSFGDRPRPLRAVLYALALERCLRETRRNGTDLVHLHAFGGTSLERYTLTRARSTGLPVVLTAHDILSLGEEDTRRGLVRYYAGADALIVHNRASRHAITALAGDLAPHQVPHGHYLHTFDRTPDRDEARQRLGVGADTFLLLFFGQIKPAKGLDLLLGALPSAREHHPEIRLLIAGRAWRDRPQRYRELIDSLSLGSIVDFRHGFVADEDVPDLFAATNLVVLPYHRVYQSGVALLAMSLGRAVLAADLPALAETLEDHRTGFLFRRGDVRHLSDRLVELAAGRPSLDEIGLAARARVRQRHDWTAIGERTLAIYRDLLS